MGRQTWFLLALQAVVILLEVQEDTLLISIRGETARWLVTKKQEAEASGSQAGAKSYV